MRDIKFIGLGALVLSIWFALSWMLPWHDPLTYKPMPNGEEIAQLLSESIDSSGTYAYPGPPSGSSIGPVLRCSDGPGTDCRLDISRLGGKYPVSERKISIKLLEYPKACCGGSFTAIYCSFPS